MVESDESTGVSNVIQLIAQVATPVLVAFIGFAFNRTVKRLEGAQWASQKVVEKRISVYDDVAPGLNDLYCYFLFVGNWKDLTPPALIQIKRRLDKEVYVYAALFSSRLITAYAGFINTCFETYAGHNRDARLRTPISSDRGDRSQATPAWDATWEKYFSPDISERLEVRRSYQDLMAAFAQELGLGLASASEASKVGTNS